MTHGYTLEKVPEEMLAADRWVCWRYEERRGKRTKVPYNPNTDQLAASTRADTWGSHEAAVRALHRCEHSGVGFVLGGGWVGVDIDHAVVHGVVSPEARQVCGRLLSYTELSPSREGIHVILRGTLPGPGRKRNSYEIYSDGRYFTVTGWRLDEYGSRAVECPDLPAIYQELFPGRPAAPTPPRTVMMPRADRGGPPAPVQVGRDGPPAHLPDDELLRRISLSKQGMKFDALWRGDWKLYYGSQSEADAALCSILIWWTGGDAARVDRLFQQSGLMRQKWLERRGQLTYGQRTITRVGE